jgi:hypothetical protein
MRTVFVFILLTRITSCVFGQDNGDNNKMVGFNCYRTGQPTKTVEDVTDVLLKNNYKAISDLLKNGHGGEKFLATISLEKLAALGRYQLSDNEKKLINKIKTSGQKVSVCDGCTYVDKVSLKQMFLEDNFLGANWWIDKILNPDKQ